MYYIYVELLNQEHKASKRGKYWLYEVIVYYIIYIRVQTSKYFWILDTCMSGISASYKFHERRQKNVHII